MNEDAQTELEDALKKAYSYESRAGWGAQDLTTAFVGTVDKGERVYDLYVDSAGNYWHKVRIRTKSGPAPEREAIFGKRKVRRFQRRR